MATEPGIEGIERPKSKRLWLWIGAAIVIIAVVGAVSWGVLSSGGSGQTLLDATLTQLEEDVRQNPQDLNARLSVAIAYSIRGLDQNAIEQFQEALKLEENNQTALMGMGRVYLAQGDTERALTPLLQVADLNKDNPRRFSIEQLEAVYYDLGTIYVQKKDYDQAIKYFYDALQINPVDADAWYRLGDVQSQIGAFEQAIQSYHKSIRLVPNFVEAFRSMADTYHVLGQKGGEQYALGMIHLAGLSYDDAVKALRESVRIDPQRGEAYEGLGLALESLGQKDEARTSYQKAMELDSTLMLAQFGLQRLESR